MTSLSGGQLVARMLKKEGVSTRLHASRAPRRAHLRGLRGRGHPHHRHAPRAGRRARRRRVGAADPRRGGGDRDRRSRRHRRRHRRRQRVGGGEPAVLIGGAAPTFNQGRGSLQEMEQVDLFQRITKWSERVPSPDLVPSYLAKAFRVAPAGRPGPVFLEIPWDVLSNGADEALADAQVLYRTDARSPGESRRSSTRRSRCSPGPSARSSWPARPSGATTRSARSIASRRAPDPGLSERHGARLPAAGASLVLRALAQGRPLGGRRRARHRHAARLPARLRHRADVRRAREGDPGGHRRDRDRPEPAHRRRDRRRLAERPRGARLRGAGSARGVAAAASREGGGPPREAARVRGERPAPDPPLPPRARARDGRLAARGTSPTSRTAGTSSRSPRRSSGCPPPAAGSTRGRSARSASARPSRSRRSSSRRTGPCASSRATARSA